MKLKYIWLLLIFVGFIACSEKQYDVPDYSPPELVAGSADFSQYVSVGNSLAAGFTDGALFKAGQANSYPNILAQKMALVGGGNFTQPWMNDNNGGLLLGGQKIQNQRLYFDGSGPALIAGEPTTDVLSGVPGPYSNMGVPGAKSFHLLANGYGSLAGLALGKANPYFVRMASSPNASVMEDVMAQSPTFFSLWIGGNDVLTYALSGGSGVNQAGNYDPTTYGGADITDPIVFAQVYNGLVSTLTSGGAKGVVANIPYVTTIPHFTTVPYNPVPLDQATADMLNGAFAPYNGGLLQAESFGLISAAERAARTIHFIEGNNAVTIVDEDLTDLTALQIPSYRHATADDLLVLTSASFIGTTVGGNPQLINGVSVPLDDKWVLIPGEQDEIKIATDLFNTSIKNIAAGAGLAFVDANAIMQDMANGGFRSGDFILTSDLVLGGAFSLDGVHLTARGYAAVANEMFVAIDLTYGSNFSKAKQLVDIGEYPAFYPAQMP